MTEEYEEEYYDDEDGEDYYEEQDNDAECEYNEEGGADGDIQVGEEIDLVSLLVPGVNSMIHMAKGHDALCYCRVCLLTISFFPFPCNLDTRGSLGR